MGACDHPTISQPGRLGRFGSTLCYPAIGRNAFQLLRFEAVGSSALPRFALWFVNKVDSIQFETSTAKQAVPINAKMAENGSGIPVRRIRPRFTTTNLSNTSSKRGSERKTQMTTTTAAEFSIVNWNLSDFNLGRVSKQKVPTAQHVQKITLARRPSGSTKKAPSGRNQFTNGHPSAQARLSFSSILGGE